MTKHCYHCHSVIPDGTSVAADIGGQERLFCCHACLAVAEFIAGSNLSHYYNLRNQAAPRPTTIYDSSRWLAYDIPEIAKQYVHTNSEDNEIHLYIDGIHCAACSWLITSVLKEKCGLDNVHINATTARAEIHYPIGQTLSPILEAIAALGYTPNLFTPEEMEQRNNRHRNQALLRLIVAGLGMMQVMMFAAGLYTGEYFGIEREYAELLRWISFIFATPVFFYSGFPFLKSAWLGLKARRVNMDVPVAAAISGAYFASVYHTIFDKGEVYFDSVTMFIFFLSISRFLEFLTRRRAQLNEVHFAKLLPEAVEKYDSDGIRRLTPLTTIQVGDKVRILPAQTIAIDGTIIHGQTRIDETMLTGERTAIVKQTGDTVLAGTHNLESPIDIEVTATGQQTMLAGIRRLMARAEQHKSRQLAKGEKLAEWTIISVLILALAGYLIWQFIAPHRAFEIALAILVATCPCALSLATPAVLTAAINHAHRHAILIKQSDTLDRLLHIRHILFDKTGTLTEGNYRLIEQTIYHQDATLIWQLVKSLEQHSSHPIAWTLAAQSHLPELPLENVVHHIGQGVTGDYDGHHWAIGHSGLIEKVVEKTPLNSEKMDKQSTATIVYLANETGIQATFTLDDPLRNNIHHTLTALAPYELHIASGDKMETVKKIAQTLNIADATGGHSPASKLEQLNTFDGETLMIGDGINDAPVMAGASVSVAVGKANPLSQTQADIVLLHHGPEALPYLFRLARDTRRIIQQNLFWATVYNIIVLPLAITGHLTPWIAALGMSASSLIVVFNALRITRQKAP